MVVSNGRVLLAVVLASACAPSAADRLPTGSQSIVASESGEVVYAVNPDEGTLSRLNVATGAVTDIAVGVAPARVARAGDRLFVTLQGESKIAVVTDAGGQMTVSDSVRTGAEPVGVVTSRDGKFIYVAVTLQDVVEERDAETLALVRSFPVLDQPTWLALHPSGERLYVGTAMSGEVMTIDLRDGETSEAEVPVITRDNGEEVVELEVRVTGDLAVSPDGETLVAPGLYVDNTTPIDEPTLDEPVVSGYGSSGLGVSRTNPTLLTWELDGDGDIEPDSEKAVFLGVQTGEFIGEETMVATFTTDSSVGPPIFRSMPTSAVARPDSSGWIVTLEGSNAALAVSRAPFDRQGDSPSRFGEDVDGSFDVATSTCINDECKPPPPFVSPVQGGFWERPIVAIDTDAGPRGVAFTNYDEAFLHAGLARTVSEIPSLRNQMDQVRGGSSIAPLVEAEPSVVVAQSALSPEAERGRLLFHSAVDPRMASSGAGISCSTCHYQGRSDGIVWTFADGPRNTMSLAGGVHETGPFTWVGGVESVAEEAFLTSQGRMGGDGITTEDLADIEAYVAQIRPVAVPVDADLVAAGQEIFNRPDTACGTCHTGDAGTDNQLHLVVGFEAQTPMLRGIAATAPYFHDGSARTLREVLAYASAGAMGHTGDLTEAELDALEAYLRSL